MSRLGDHGMKFRPVRPVRPFPPPRRVDGAQAPASADMTPASGGPSAGSPRTSTGPSAGRPPGRPPPPSSTSLPPTAGPSSGGRPPRPPPSVRPPLTPPTTQRPANRLGPQSSGARPIRPTHPAAGTRGARSGPAGRPSQGRPSASGESSKQNKSKNLESASKDSAADVTGDHTQLLSPPSTAQSQDASKTANATSSKTGAATNKHTKPTPHSPPQGPITYIDPSLMFPPSDIFGWQIDTPHSSNANDFSGPGPVPPELPSALDGGSGTTGILPPPGTWVEGAPFFPIDPVKRRVNVKRGHGPTALLKKAALAEPSGDSSARTRADTGVEAEAVGSESTPVDDPHVPIGPLTKRQERRNREKAKAKALAEEKAKQRSIRKRKRAESGIQEPLFAEDGSDERVSARRGSADADGVGVELEDLPEFELPDGEDGMDVDGETSASAAAGPSQVSTRQSQRQPLEKKIPRSSERRDREKSIDPEAEVMEEEGRARGNDSEAQDLEDDEDASSTNETGRKRKRSASTATDPVRRGRSKRPPTHGRASLFGPDRLAPDSIPGDLNGPYLDEGATTMARLTRDPGHGRVSAKGLKLQRMMDEKAIAEERDRERRRARERGEVMVDVDMDEDGGREEEVDADGSSSRVKKDDRGSAVPAVASIPETTIGATSSAQTADDEEDEYDFTGHADTTNSGPVVLAAMDEQGNFIVDQTTTSHDVRSFAQNGNGLPGEGDEVQELNDDLTFVNSGTYAKRKKTARWDKSQEAELLRRLLQFGESLDMLGFFFKERTQKELRVKIGKMLDRDPELAMMTLKVRPKAEDYLELERMTGFSLSTPIADHAVLHVDESRDPIPSGTVVAKARAERAKNDRAAAAVAAGVGGKKKRGKVTDGLEVMETEEMPED